MPKAYVVLTEDIHDPAGMDEYGRQSGPTLAPYGGQVVSVDTDVTVLEGSWHGSRTVIVEFPDADAAKAWYDSDAYREARAIRQAASTCNVVISRGWAGPSR